MNFSLSSLLAGFIFGVLGMYFVKRGKKEGHIPLFTIGIVLIGYSYFVDNIYVLWSLGAVLFLIALRLAKD